MQQNAFVQSMKTIAQSLINKAGFDKTRSGKVVGVNTLTNTYSIKLDGHVYSNVRTVNDSTYNVGDTVKVNIPMNNPSQMYITASIFSDSSIGNKIGHAQSLIDQANEAIEDITVILGRIYQLSIKVTYSSGQDGAVIATYQAVLTQDGQDVTSQFSASRFHWFLQDVTGVVEKGTGTSISLSSADYLYGQTILCEWWEVDSDVVLLRARATLFNNAAVEEVKIKVDEAWEIATNEAQYFWFSENEGDNGAHISYYSKDDFMSNPRGGNLLANANGVAVRKGLQEILGLYADPNNSERNGLYFNGYIGSGSQASWGLIAKYTGTGIEFNENIPYTIGNGTSYIKYLYEGGKYKIKIAADQITLGGVEVAKKTDIVNDVPYLTEITSGGVFVHRADSGYNGTTPTAPNAYGVKIADAVELIRAGIVWGSFGNDQIIVGNTRSGYYNTYMSPSSVEFRVGTTVLSKITSNYAQIGQANYYNTYIDSSSVKFKYGSTVCGEIASSYVTLGRYASGYYNAYISSSGVYLRDYTTNLASFTSTAATVGSTSSCNTYMTSSGVYLRNGTTNLASFTSSSIQLGTTSYCNTYISTNSISLRYQSQTLLALYTTGMYLYNSSGGTLASITSSGLYLYNGSGTKLADFRSNGFTCNSGNFEVYISGVHTYMYITGSNGNTNFVLDSRSDNNRVEISSQFGGLLLWSTTTGVALGVDGSFFRPTDNKATNLGTSSSYRWDRVYCVKVDESSDRKFKNIIGNISYAHNFIMNLKPIEYTLKNSNHQRIHMGFIAQDVAAIGKKIGKDLSLYSAEYIPTGENELGRKYYGEDADDNLLEWGLSYNEIIAPLVQVVQDQQKTIEDLLQRIERLEQKE